MWKQEVSGAINRMSLPHLLLIGYRGNDVLSTSLIGQNCAPKITCLFFRAKPPVCCVSFLRGSRDAVLKLVFRVFAAVLRGVRHGCCHNNHRKCRGDGEGRIGRKVPKVIPSIPGGVSNFGRPGLMVASIAFTQLTPYMRHVAFLLIASCD